MKRNFLGDLRCPFCEGRKWGIAVSEENPAEIREGSLSCEKCSRNFPIRNGVADFLDPSDEALAREVKGWIDLAGPLGDNLIPTMTALPCYPHYPWPNLAPDFFQIFEEVSFRGLKVVDIGAGRTWSSRHLVALGQAKEVVAIDVLTTRFLGLETADIYFGEDQIFYERLRGDAHHMPLIDGWADVVFACASIHHSSDLAALYREISRVLRPGGTFIFVSEPCKKASIDANQFVNAETEHGINEHFYSYAEYLRPLRRQKFRYRRILPRSIGFLLLYPDKDFESGIPAYLRPLARTRTGQRLLLRIAASRILGPLLYQFWSLPISVIAEAPGSSQRHAASGRAQSS